MSGGGNPIRRVLDAVTDTVRDVVVEPVMDTAGSLLSPVTDALKPDIPQQESKEEAKPEGFEEISKSAELVEERKKKDGSDSNLVGAQRAALGARRRQSLYSTSQSRSLLG